MQNYYSILNKIFILFIALICLIYPAFADYSVDIDNQIKKVKSIKIKETDFVNYEQFFKALAPDIKMNTQNHSLISNALMIRCYTNNFYILIETDSAQNVLQLAVPAIEINKITYIPLVATINGLKEIYNINYKISSNTLNINSNTEFNKIFRNKKIEKNEFQPVTNISTNSNNSTKINPAPTKKEIINTNIIDENKTTKSIVTPPKSTIPVDNSIKKNTNLNEINNISKKTDIPNVKNDKAPITSTKNNENKIIEKTEIITHDTISQNSGTTINKKNMYSNTSQKSIDVPVKSTLPENNQNNNLKQQPQSTYRINESPVYPVNSTNKALPPFRKYSIPDNLLKKKLDELK